MDAKEIKKLRGNLGLTQVKFASKLGVYPLTVQNWESSRFKPSPLALEKLLSLKQQVK